MWLQWDIPPVKDVIREYSGLMQRVIKILYKSNERAWLMDHASGDRRKILLHCYGGRYNSRIHEWQEAEKLIHDYRLQIRAARDGIYSFCPGGSNILMQILPAHF